MKWAAWSSELDARHRELEQPAPAVRRHLIDRMRDRAIGIAGLDRLRRWVESKPVVPEGDWYKHFGSFKLCGQGSFPKTLLLRGQAAKGTRV